MIFRHWLDKLLGRASRRPSLAKHPRPRPRLAVEKLEDRYLLSFSPIQVRHAYGFDRVAFLDSAHAQVTGDGHGQTIAIVDPNDDPNISSDLATFDSHFGLAAPPSFQKVNQTGGTTYPTPDQASAAEIALDVEYAHAMAPGANILLVEANDYSLGNLNAAVQYAASRPGVVALSMSYGVGEFSGETSHDSVFTHAGVTYLSSTGDFGAPGQYQAYSPNVVAVGGTTLTLDGSGNYSSESGWSYSVADPTHASGGGISQYEAQPSYQTGVVTQSTTRRTIPDVSIVADPNTGVTIYDTYGGSGYYNVGGTSASCPIMAGLVAVVDQGRSYLNGLSSYNSLDFLNAVYHLPDNAVHDILTGNNGFAAGPGYDLVTGRGTPIVQRFVAGMTGDPVLDPITSNLLIVGGGRLSSDTLTVDTSGNLLTVSFNLSAPVPGNGRGGSYTLSYPIISMHSIEVVTHGEGSYPVSFVDIDRTPAGVPTTVRTAGHDVVNLGTGAGRSVQGILGPVTVDPLAYSAGLTVDDWADGAAHGAVTLSDPGTGFGQITGVAPGTISYRSAGTSGVTVWTGAGSNTVNVLDVVAPLTLVGNSNSTAVNVGRNRSLASIQNTLTVRNLSFYTDLRLDDSADTANRTVTLTSTGVTGLSAGAISFTFRDLKSLTILGGSGSNTYTVNGTPGDSFFTGTTLNTGNGVDTVNVQATSSPLTINGGGTGADVVNVGNANSLAGIQGALTLNNDPNWSHVNINDGADTANHANVILTDTSLTGLAPATITFQANSLDGLTVTGGSGSNTYTVVNTAYSGVGNPTTLNTGNGTDTVNVQATAASAPLTVNAGGTGADVVNVGNAGSLAGIQGALTLNNGPNWSHVNINDGADATNHPNVILTDTSLTGLAPATITLQGNSLDGLTINGGGGNNAYTVVNTQAVSTGGGNPTTLNTGDGTDTVNIQATAASAPLTINGGNSQQVVNLGNAGSLAAIQGAVSLNNVPNYFTVNVNDGSDNGNHSAVVIGATGVIGLAPAPINLSTTPICVNQLNVTVGNGSNAFTITDSQPGSGTTLTTGTGTNTVTVTGTNGPTTLTGSPAGVNTLVGPTAATTWSVTGANTGNFSSAVAATSFTGYGSLTGGSVANTFVFSDGASLSGNLDGGSGGSNTLDSSAYSTAESFTLTGRNAGTGTPVAAFLDIQNVIGARAGGSYFQFADGASLDGNLAGGGGATLDYSPYTTSVVVDLQPAVARATGVGGSLSGVTSVIGASGAPGTPGLYNLLIGSDVGGDTLQGGTGRRNLLVAGGGASTLIGGDGEDLLIGGTTIYDTDPALTNWRAIANYWAGTDDFATRSANLQSGTGVPLLDATTVTGNGGGNTFQGNGGTALIYTDALDTVFGFGATALVPIAP